jgi:predicted nucleic acid-binding Zn ribbon protein
MPIYIYETTNPGKPPRRFEIKQRMQDPALTTDPATGEPARRLITGGFGILVVGKYKGPSVGSVGSH